MPFKSRSQIRKFAVLMEQGKISHDTFNKWAKETKGKLPERKRAKKK